MPRNEAMRDLVRAPATARRVLSKATSRRARLNPGVSAVEDAEARLALLGLEIKELLPARSMAALIQALQAIRGVAEVGDFSQLVVHVGLVRSERSSDTSVRPA